MSLRHADHPVHTLVQLLAAGCLLAFVCSCSGCPGAGRPSQKPTTKQPVAAVEEVKAKPRKLIPWTGEAGAIWKDYDRLTGEQKYEAAAKVAREVLDKAKAAKDSEQWARAMVRTVQLRTALHGYETAVRFLKEQPWPDDLMGHVALNLFYANGLAHYARAYSWEIRQRERVQSKKAVDLKAWTLDQIYAEASRAYAAVWAYHDQLGGISTAKLAEYVHESNYPRDIRDSLRDTVSYLWAQLLADTSAWRPEHANQVYELDLPALIQGRDSTSASDTASHPLGRIATILGRLEQWHRSQGRAEATFEARITRLEIFARSFTQEDQRGRIREDLRSGLESVRGKPWWSMGMAKLAEMVRQYDPDPDNLIRARKIASRGHRAFPDSLGGRRCLHIVKSIELPEFRLNGMASDAANKRSLDVVYKNVEKLHFRAYAMDLQQLIESSKGRQFFPTGRKLTELLMRHKPTHTWSAPLPPTKDFKQHRKFLVPPMSRPGYYLVVASLDSSFSHSRNILRASNVVIGDLVLTHRQHNGRLQVQTLSGSTGQPVAGTKILLYEYDWKRKHRMVATRISGKDGRARFGLTRTSRFLLARKNGQVALDQRSWSQSGSSPPRDRMATLLYTDRSIYRPLHTIQFKAVLYKGRRDKANFRTAPGTKLTVTLRDGNSQSVATKTLRTNRFGTASGSFTVPKGRVLGQWSLQSSRGGSTYLRVEEYKRPTFEAKLLDAKTPLRLNKTARLRGQARYLFGLPVVNAKARWRVTRQPIYPWWWSYHRSGGRQGGRTQTVAAGTSALDDEGRFTIGFTPQADERLAAKTKEISYAYYVSVEVTDEGGETRTAARTFRLGFVAVQASISMDKGFVPEGQPVKLAVWRTNLDGAAAPGKGNYRLVALKGPRQALLPADQPRPKGPIVTKRPYDTPDDDKRPRYQHGYRPDEALRTFRDGRAVARGSLRHEKGGAVPIELASLSAGAYRLHYSTTDSFGAKFHTSRDFVVGGKRCRIPLPALLRLEASSVGVGGKARVLVHSGLARQRMRFEIHRRGNRVEERILEAGTDATLIEIPVTEKDRGGLSMSLSLLRDHQWITLSRSVYVPWDNKQLEVSFATFRDKLRPGGQETWTVKVTGPAGSKRAVRAAELLAYMYDRALDAFAPHSVASPLSMFPSHGGHANWGANLGQARQSWVSYSGFRLPSYDTPVAARLRTFSGYGVGGPGHRGGYGRGPHPVLAESGRPAPAPPRGRKSGRRLANKKLRLASTPVKQRPEQDRSSDQGASLVGTKREPRGTLGADATSKAAPMQLRKNFSETAFWQPHLITGADGSAQVSFTVPDSVTGWQVWVHAITRDLQSGSVNKQTRSVKDLMVRPYLPRFLREGDRASLKVVVNNASDKPMRGYLSFDIIDPSSEKSVLASFGLSAKAATDQPFTVEPGKSTSLSFPIKTPMKVGPIAFKVTAASGSISDGELRPLPVLPGRMHLVQSRFAVLKDATTRHLRFVDLAKQDDPTRVDQQMVVTIDGQLFYSVLSALPYLVNYPYSCTEQTLNRFLATGILSSMYAQYPAIAQMAKKFSRRGTRLERWDDADPNRRMALEETPWLRQAQGGVKSPHPLTNVLDPRIAKAQRAASLKKLTKAQTSVGGFPWFPGGPPSPYITLYLLHGLSRALEFGVDVPREMVHRAWSYLHRHYINELVRQAIALDCCWELVTMLNYVLSNFPDPSWYRGTFTPDERRTMLDFSFKHWKDHAPYLKGYLALTLHRANRKQNAKLVWDSVMDSAKTTADQGTFWAPEDRGWLWYNDTIETHAFAIRTLMELQPKEPKLDGLVLWLFLNKKLNHWKSTRATAEVIYSLAHYLKQTKQLGLTERIHVEAGPISQDFVFRPDEYSGKKNQIVIPGPQIKPKSMSTVTVSKKTRGHAFASATWHYSTEQLPDEARGDYLKVSRRFFKRIKSGKEVVLRPMAEGAKLAPGDEVEVQISLRAKHTMEYVHLRDPRGAGFEPVSHTSRHKWDLGIYWYEEIRDSGTNFFFERLPQGEYTFKYRLRAAIAGKFKVAPATAQPMYAPEFAGFSRGTTLSISADAKQ